MVLPETNLDTASTFPGTSWLWVLLARLLTESLVKVRRTYLPGRLTLGAKTRSYWQAMAVYLITLARQWRFTVIRLWLARMAPLLMVTLPRARSMSSGF